MSFTLFSTQTCAFCTQVEKYLTYKNHTYKKIDVTDDFDKRVELQNKYGAMTVPVLVRDDGEFMVGFSPQRIAALV